MSLLPLVADVGEATAERPIARPAPTKAHAYGSMPSTTCEGAQKHKVSAKGASGMKVGPTEDDAALP